MRFPLMIAFALLAWAALSEVRTESLGDGLWRVRMSRGGQWPESGLNRYGILAKPTVRSVSQSLEFGKIRPQVRQVGKGFELRFPLADGERIYGLGDVSRDNIQRRGGRYEIWVKNVNSYIPIPMAMSSRGWGVLVNTTRKHVFDVGKTDPGVMTVTADEGEVDFYVMTGTDYRELLDVYTKLAGRPALLPVFAFGFTFVANQWIDMFGLVDEADRFREHDLPCDVLGLEPPWMEYFYDYTTKKTWNVGRFSFPFWSKSRSITWIGALERMGFKLSLWSCMDYDLFVFEEACAGGKAAPSKEKAKRVQKDDAPETWSDPHVEGSFAETGNSSQDIRTLASEVGNARRMSIRRPDGLSGRDESGEEPWFDHWKKFVDRGVRCFKLDAANQVAEFPDRIWAGRMTDAEAHNMYPLVYGKQMAEGYEVYTDRRAMIYSAGGYAGIQHYVATWAGDTGGGVRPLVSCLNLGMSGHPNQSCDMSINNPVSLHFGFLAPWSQQNNWDYFRQPWYQEKADFEVFKSYLHLRYRLVPYLYGAAAMAAQTGWPIMRALPLVYPDVPDYANECGTYMLGDSLLVSAFVPEMKIPEGRWFDFRTGEAVDGPSVRPVIASADWGGGLLVKAGAVIPMWPVKQHLEKGWSEEVVLHVWLGADGVSAWYEDDGDSLQYREGAASWIGLRLSGRTLTIDARQGSFAGMPSAHDLTVVWHDGPRTKTVLLGTVAADVVTEVSAPLLWYYNMGASDVW